MRVSTIAVACLLGLAGPVAAQQKVITFEDVPGTEYFLPQGYAGFSWLGGGDASHNPLTSWLLSSLLNPYQCPDFRQLHKPVSGTQNAWSNAGTWLSLSSPNPFDFVSLYMAATDLRGTTTQTVRGFRDGVEVYTAAVTLDPNLLMQQFTFNFANVDEVRFDDRRGFGNLVVDDIAVKTTSTPEPASLALVVTGFIGVYARRRRV